MLPTFLATLTRWREALLGVSQQTVSDWFMPNVGTDNRNTLDA